MGTRSLTIIYDELDQELCTLYRQMDGDLNEHGRELAEFLSNRTLVNGIGISLHLDDKEKANGMGCLAAQLVSHFKEDFVGSFYLVPSGSDCDEDFTYRVYPKGKKLDLEVSDSKYDVIFSGDPTELVKRVKQFDN